jgi:hypothetical protein
MRVVIAALLLLPSHAFSWGSQGHQAIADDGWQGKARATNGSQE